MVAQWWRRGSVPLVTDTPKPTTIRLDPDVRRRVDQFARDTRRTVNAAVNVLLAEALDARTPECNDRKGSK